MILSNVRAELFGVVRRPGPWIVAACWGVQILFFAYTVPYLVYRTSGDSMKPAEAAALFTPMLPQHLDYYIVTSFAIYGGPIMLVTGALLAAGDYRWGTLRTFLSRQGGRVVFVAGRLVSVVVVMAAMTVLTLGLSTVASVTIALVDGSAVHWPDAAHLVRSTGAIWLITCAWAVLGFTLGVLTRGIAAAIGIGLLWTLALENSLGLLASVVKPLKPAQDILISKSTSAVAHLLGAPESAASVIPGVSIADTGSSALLVLAGYVVVGGALSMVVFRRRDVT